MIEIALTDASMPAKKRILTTCVRLFLEQGYKATTVATIIADAKVSCSSFQNIFRSKDGVLTELVQYMFQNQFNAAYTAAGRSTPPIYTYAVETALQLTLTELNENLREIYLEAYTHEEALSLIHGATAREVIRIFGPYQPELTEAELTHLELGTAGLMRGYMSVPCSEGFPLEEKLRCFLLSSLRVYRVPEAEIGAVLAYIAGLNIRSLAQKVMEELFRELAMRYEFSLEGLLPNP